MGRESRSSRPCTWEPTLWTRWRTCELLLRGGLWGDRRLVPREWVELATRRHIETMQIEDGSRDADSLCGYGYQFWVSRHGYYGDGAFGSSRRTISWSP
ncbi:hypothetical protein [Nonomuraea cypriaca]|uniref:hypothetical protein n=1 Tax=Nonomuraea cypriaca TaxID=1187855 RepID=UPI001A9C6F6F|nr:hypothetical protein [Nonomuraea cypriaca]